MKGKRIFLYHGKSNYIVTLKSRKSFLWLFLLLLPLLCFIFPCTTPPVIVNIDYDTGERISGVMNVVTLDNGDNYTLISDSLGEFQIKRSFKHRVVSIVADGSNINYSLNDTTIKNITYSELLESEKDFLHLPLRLGNICVKFINVDHCNNTPIQNVQNTISFNNGDTYIKEISNSRGEFEVCGLSYLKPTIKSENLRYKSVKKSIENEKTLREYAVLKQPVAIPMEMKGETGKLNFRLLWDEKVDVDFRITDPNGHEVDSHESGKNRFTECPCGGKRDIDNTSGGYNSIENIFWKYPTNGEYKIKVQLHSGGIETKVRVVVRSGCKTREFFGTVSPKNKEVFFGKVKYPF